MRIKRKLIAAMMTGLAVMLSAALLGGTLTVATSAAHSAAMAKAKAKKKPKKVTCPKGTVKKGKVCIKTVKTTEKVNVSVPGPETVRTEVVTKEVLVTGPTKVENPVKIAEEKVLAEELALVHPGLAPSETKEAGGTKAIESVTEIPAAPKFTNEQLDAYSSGNWITSMGGNNGDHYSDLTEINASNVSGLKSNWEIQLDGSADTTTYGGEAPSGEYDGVLYYVTGAGDAFAISVKSGKILWVHLGELVAGAIKVCCGRDSRGVTFNNGLMYVGLVNSGVEALEMKTGKLKWYAEVGYESEGYAVTAAPLYYDGLIYIGPTGSEENVRGFMAAFNAETGALVWKKYNIPGPGEFGHETWPTNTSCFVCNYSWATGGSTTWNAPVVDPETGDILYTTANASSQFGADYYGQNRAGANLWTDSFLARHPGSGEIAWGFQITHHDIWDVDDSSAAEMINTEIGGKKVTGIAQSSKSSISSYVEATTGKPMTGGADLGIEEKPVPQSAIQQTYPTQPIPKMAPENRDLPTGTPCPTATPVLECPTIANGKLKEGPHEPTAEKDTVKEYEVIQESLDANTAKTGGPAKAERGGYPCYPQNICSTGTDIFAVWGNFPEPEVVPSQGNSSGDHQGAPAYNPKTNMWYTCGQESYNVMDINPLTDANEESYTNGNAVDYGFIKAYNMKTGETAWEHEVPHQCYSGFLTTAGNLLFVGTYTGQEIAYNAETGAQAWEFGEESNLHQGCIHGAAKKKGLDPALPELEELEGKNSKGEVVWCHDEASATEAGINGVGTPTYKLINTENSTFGNPGLGSGVQAPAIAFEFEGKEYIVIYAGGGREGETAGDFLWEFSLGGSGAATAIKDGEGTAPEKELCSTYEVLKKENKTCEGY